MGKIQIWVKNRLPSQRRLVQLYAALLYNAHLKGFIKGDIYTGPVKAVCVPGLNCYSCPGATAACPLGALQNALAASGTRAPYYVLGILLLFGLTLGRSICGWLCPVGMLQELLHRIPTPKATKNRVTRALSYLKYWILAVFVIILPLWNAVKGLPLPAFCKYICPAGTLEGAVGLLSNPVNADKFSMLGGLFTGKALVMIVVIVACIFVYRAFCRFLCPLGAIYGLFSRIALIGVRVEASKCVHCGRCERHCLMDVRHVGDHECIHCGECIDVCPTQAISLCVGGKTLCTAPKTRGRRERRRLALSWLMALLILAVAFVYFNVPETETVTVVSDVQEGTPVGKEVGMLAPDFTVPLYEGGSYALGAQSGKVQVINFWATWCTPCVAELPWFAQLQEAYSGQVSVVAVHTNLVTEDVAAYIERLGLKLPFALDESGEVLSAYGGSTMLPQTVVIDKNGVIAYNQVGSLTYEALEKIVAPCLDEGGK